jgi:hypothetical protein
MRQEKNRESSKKILLLAIRNRNEEKPNSEIKASAIPAGGIAGE